MECMENNNQIQMSATSQIQAQMKNHWKEDLHSRWPRISGNEEKQRLFCNLNITRKSLFQLVRITPFSLKIRRCIMSANMLYKKWQQRRKCPFVGRLAQKQGNSSHQGHKPGELLK